MNLKNVDAAVATSEAELKKLQRTSGRLMEELSAASDRLVLAKTAFESDRKQREKAGISLCGEPTCMSR